MAEDRCEVLCLDLPKAEKLRQRRLPDTAVEAAAFRARALADPTRLSLAASLRDGGELCVCDLAWISGRPQNLVSHHLRALKQEGLAASRRDGKIVFYSLSDAGVELLDGVLEATDASHAAERRAQQLIAVSFFVLAAYVGVESIRSLAGGHQPHASWLGIGLAAFTAPTMPLLAAWKRRVGRKLNSSAAVKEASQTQLCAYLSIALLIGLGANALL